MSRSIKSICLKQVYIVKHPIVYKFVSSLTDSSGLSIKPCIFLLFYTELNFQIKTDIVEDNWQFYLFMFILSSRRLKGTKRKTELDTSINESFFYPIMDRQKMGQHKCVSNCSKCCETKSDSGLFPVLLRHPEELNVKLALNDSC